MKHIIKNIALGAALLPVAAVAQTEKEYTDSVASQVNVAFRTVNEADLYNLESGWYGCFGWRL